MAAWTCHYLPLNCGLKPLLCKEVRLVAPPAVPFCFVLLARARWASPRTLYAPSILHKSLEGQVTATATK
jgi:hypothetical protein